VFITLDANQLVSAEECLTKYAELSCTDSGRVPMWQ